MTVWLTLQPARYGIDRWDEMMMERDRRLTGSKRGQSVSQSLWLFSPLHSCVAVALCAPHDLPPKRANVQTDPIAPKDFSTNSVWATERVQ